MYGRDAGCSTKCWQLKSNDCGNGNHLEKHLSGLPWQTLSARSQGRKSTHANLQRNFSFLRAPSFAPFCSHCFFFILVCECAAKKCTKAWRMFNCLWNLNGEITQLLKRHVCAGSFVLFCTLTISSVCLIPLSFILFLSVAGGPWGEWYTAVLWSEAGGRHLPDSEAAVVEGSTGSRFRDLGQKTSWAGNLHSDCMSWGLTWVLLSPLHQNHLHLPTSCHRRSFSLLKSTPSHCQNKKLHGEMTKVEIRGKPCSVKILQTLDLFSISVTHDSCSHNWECR